jgi:hypothetical protein
MFKIIFKILIILLLFQTTCFTQTSWKKSLDGSISFSQVSLDNWVAGGDNSWSWQCNLNGNLDKKTTTNNWTNSLKIIYGMSQLGDQSPRKSADEFKFDSVFTFSKSNFLNPYISFQALTQLASGIDYKNDPDKIVSYTFDPLYITESAGFEYNLFGIINSRYGLAAKQIIVNKTTIINSKSELGSNIVGQYQNTLFDFLKIDTTLQFFSNFKGWNKIDIYWDTNITAKITETIGWLFYLNIIYDDDLSTQKQIRQTLNIGLTFDLV